MKLLILNFKYASRSLRRGGQRSFFAILCIAVGVAAIVALQSTGLSIQGAVAGDARVNSKADVVVTNRQTFFKPEEMAKFENLKQNGTILDFTTTNDTHTLVVKKADGSNNSHSDSSYASIIIDPAKYPYYGQIKLAEPEGKSLKEVLTAPGKVVIDSKMATKTAARVGEKIQVNFEGGSGEVEVAGIISNRTPAPQNSQAAFTGYNYFTAETAKQFFNLDDLLPNTVYVKTSGGKIADEQARDAINNSSEFFKALTSAELNEQIKQASKQLNDVLGYVGLLSLLIGSVGVVNTMLVVVGRRSSEIATIKALGMEGRQTIQIFVVEAALLGGIGSVLGLVLGEGLSLLMSQVAAGFVGRNLEYNFYLQPLVVGLVTGIVTAGVFGLLPAYSASKIPPAQVLRQKTTALPRISFKATLLIIGLMTLVMGILAGVILGGEFGLGIMVAFVTLVVCALLVVAFSWLLWLVGKLPLPLGLNYKMARRNLARSRARSAITLLVMLAGIFSIALVIILASSLKDTVKDSLEKSFGYNIQYTVKDDAQTAEVQRAVDARQIPGQDKAVPFSYSNVRLVSAGGVSAEELIARKTEKEKASGQAEKMMIDFSSLIGFDPQATASVVKITGGNLLNSDDQVILDKSIKEALDLKVGDVLVYQELSGDGQFSLKVAGFFEMKSSLLYVGSTITTYNRMQTIKGHQNGFEFKVTRGKVDEAIKYLETTYPGSNATDLSNVTEIINRLIDNFTAFPILLAFLSLVAGAVLMANNVALAVLERRTEMGVMKSLGADSNRVLAIINLETGIVGFLGGLLGFGLAAVAGSVLISLLGTEDNPAVLTLSPFVFWGMLALAVGLSLAATFVSAWNAAREKPLVVLRYE